MLANFATAVPTGTTMTLQTTEFRWNPGIQYRFTFEMNK
jgi:hypothetical protein